MLWILLTSIAAGGVAVGHPNVHGAWTDLNFEEFELDVTTVELRRCNGQPETVQVNAVISHGEDIELPAGCFDRMRVNTEGLRAEGTGGGGSFVLDLSPGQIDVFVPRAFEPGGTTPCTLELASSGWVSIVLLDLGPGESRTVDGEDPLFDDLNAALRNDSSLSW